MGEEILDLWQQLGISKDEQVWLKSSCLCTSVVKPLESTRSNPCSTALDKLPLTDYLDVSEQILAPIRLCV